MKPVTLLLLFSIVVVCGCNEPQKPPVSRHEPLLDKIERIAKANQIPPDLAMLLVGAESHFNENALSPTNAVGLTQVLRSTAKGECKVRTLTKLAEVDTNLDCGFKYLRKLRGQTGSWRGALISYNAGPGNFANPKLDPKKYRDGVKYAEGILRKVKS